MTISANFPALKPSLLLDFANVERLDPRITFTRASNATYFDANGVLQTASSGVARFDHNPTTLQSLGLLIEEQRTNSLLQSGWDGAVAGSPGTAPTSWSISSVGSPSLQVANAQYGTAIPALALTFNCVATERHWLSQTINVTSGVQYAISVWVEAVTGNAGAVMTITNGTGTATINQTVNNPSTPGRYTLLFTATGTGTINVRCGAGTTSGVSGSVSIRLSRIQLEAGAFATSYIPTTTAAATRNADVATMTGTNFSSWYNATEGTIYSEHSYLTTGVSNQCAFSIDNGTSNEVIVSASTTPAIDRIIITSGGVGQVSNFGNFTFSANQVIKRTVAVKLNDAATVANNSNISTDNVFVMPSPTQLVIGAAGYFASSRLNGHIRRIAYWGVRLDNSKLQALTT